MEFVKLSHSIRDFETVDVVPSLNNQSNGSVVIIYLMVGYFPEFLSS